MPALSEYSNVNASVLNVLAAKGYRLWCTDLPGGDAEYWAEKDGWDFRADTPCALLGLVALFEHKQPDAYREYWWHEDGPLTVDSLPGVAPQYESVIMSSRGLRP
jgi:hypothetical protein